MSRRAVFPGVSGGLLVLGLMSGCSFTQPTLSQTGEEHRQSVRGVWERDKAALMDDLDLLFQTDRPTRLTKWQDK